LAATINIPAMLSSSASSTDDRSGEGAHQHRIEALARQITATSAKNGHHGENNAVAPIKGSKLDPFSPTFDSFLWIQALRKLYESDPDSAPSRMTGVAFRNLNVFGHGVGARFQESTGNIIPSMATAAFGHLTGRGMKRVDILRDFEGVVHPKEMLLVLGPPGSGCSTFLKTLSGRTEGLNVTDDSYINFRGAFCKPQTCNSTNLLQASTPSTCTIGSVATSSIMQRSTSTCRPSASGTP
jgi:hypothetical protein